MNIQEEYVQFSTSGDNNVCPMCAQFEGKFFLINEADKRNQLKYLLRYSKQIKKIKHSNTNELYYIEK